MPSLKASEILTFENVENAAQVLDGVVVETPLLESQLLNSALGCRLRIKPEPLQVTGSFKFRGAYNAISHIPEIKRSNGVVAYSSGNHGQGVAAAAKMMDMPAVILMPHDAPATKVALTKMWDAEVVGYDRVSEDRNELARQFQQDRGAKLIKPYDDPLIMAGQGTLALEAMKACASDDWPVDLFLSPCGGGGLLAGCSTVIQYMSPATAIYAVEPNGFDDTARSLETGEPVENRPGGNSICDALMSLKPGELTFRVNRKRLSGGLTVSDDETLIAMATAFRYFKLVVEPGGAVALAAVLSGKIDVSGKNLIVVCSGGNADSDRFTEALAMPVAI